MRRPLLIAAVVTCLAAEEGARGDAVPREVTTQGSSPTLHGNRNALPPGATARVPRQVPPRMNVLSEILAWPEPPQASWSIQLLTFSPDGKQLAIASANQSIRVVDASSGKETAHSTNRDRHTHLLRYTDDGQLIAVSTSWKDGNQSLAIWNVLADKTICEFTLLRSDLPKDSPLSPIGVGHLVLSPDGHLLVGEAYSRQGRRTIATWDLANKKEGKLLVPDESAPGPYKFSPDSKWLVSSGLADSPIRLWDIATGKELCRLAGLQDRIHQFAFSPDGQVVATGLTNDTICMWQVPAGKEIRRCQGHEQRTTYVAFSPNGLTLVSGSEDKTVRIWDVVTGKEIRTWSGHESATGPVAFSPDGRKVASGSFDGTVFIWDVTTAAASSEVPAQKLQVLWDDLGRLDAGKAHCAFWTMAGRPLDSVAFLKERLAPVRVPDDRRIEQLIVDLNDDQFARRQHAMRRLEEITDIVEPKLRAALKAGSQSLEARRRIESLLGTLAETSPKMVRQRRAVAVLEAIGTTEAKAILESLATGPQQARLTRESRAALSRLRNFKERQGSKQNP
jgi:dipeptidyl aminopeptidase/acylaminoacyl peptidase